MIAMGTHGHGFLRGALIGNLSHDVIRHASVPIESARPAEPIEVLYGRGAEK